MSTLRDLDAPELLILASVNLSEVGAAPAGTFSRQIVLSAGSIYIPTIDGARIDTRVLDRALESRRTEDIVKVRGTTER